MCLQDVQDMSYLISHLLCLLVSPVFVCLLILSRHNGRQFSVFGVLFCVYPLRGGHNPLLFPLLLRNLRGRTLNPRSLLLYTLRLFSL